MVQQLLKFQSIPCCCWCCWLLAMVSTINTETRILWRQSFSRHVTLWLGVGIFFVESLFRVSQISRVGIVDTNHTLYGRSRSRTGHGERGPTLSAPNDVCGGTIRSVGVQKRLIVFLLDASTSFRTEFPGI